MQKTWFVSMWVEQPLEQLMQILISIRSGIRGRFVTLLNSCVSYRSSVYPWHRRRYLGIVKNERNIGAIMNSVSSLIVVLRILSQIFILNMQTIWHVLYPAYVMQHIHLTRKIWKSQYSAFIKLVIKFSELRTVLFKHLRFLFPVGIFLHEPTGISKNR